MFTSVTGTGRRFPICPARTSPSWSTAPMASGRGTASHRRHRQGDGHGAGRRDVDRARPVPRRAFAHEPAVVCRQFQPGRLLSAAAAKERRSEFPAAQRGFPARRLVRALATWTVDGGAGMDDQLVIFSTNGEAAIYSRHRSRYGFFTWSAFSASTARCRNTRPSTGAAIFTA